MHRIQKVIAEFVKGEPIPAVGPDEPVTRAMETMKERASDCALVIAQDKLIGIFTERDFLYRVMAERRSPAMTRIAEVMTPDPQALRPGDSVAYAINCMVTRGFRNIPVVDDQGQAIAILDVRDIIQHITEVFDELEDIRATVEVDEWTDIGGGD